MKYIIALIYFSLFGVFFYGAAKLSRRSSLAKVTCILLFSLLTTYVLVFHQSIIPVKISDQLSVISQSIGLELPQTKKHIHTKFENFTSVNVVKDGNSEEVTRRDDVLRLLQLVNDSLQQNDHFIDLLVLDIFFIDNGTEDSALVHELNLLHEKRKIILAYDDSRNLDKDIYTLGNYEMFGAVFYNPRIGHFLSNKLYEEVTVDQSEFYMPSLPYLSYLRLAGAEAMLHEHSAFLPERTLITEASTNDKRLVLNETIPILYPELEAQFSGEEEGAHRVVQDLNASFQPLPFAFLLSQQRSANQQNVVFVGQFKDTFDDVHQTSYGPMHGSVILQSSLINFQMGYHHNTFWYILTVLLCFIIIYGILFFRRPHAAPAHSEEGKHPMVKVLKEIWEILVLHHLPYWLLFIAYYVIYLIHHKIILVTPLFVLLLILSSFLTAYGNKAHDTHR